MCHISDEVKQNAKSLEIDLLIIPGGCPGKIQVPDVSWNKPFKKSIVESYDHWVENGAKSYTPKGNIRAASKTVLCDWVVKAWKSLSSDLIIKSYVDKYQMSTLTKSSDYKKVKVQVKANKYSRIC